MTNDSYLDARACRRRQASPVALAACAFIAAMALPVAPAAAAPEPKVEVCHIPPGNPGNFHTITISENALSAHLAHGDVAGSCNAICDLLCNDNNVCTIDHQGNCEDDGCLSPGERPPVNCNDGNACTEDEFCHPTDGCTNAPQPGNSCDDGDACTNADICDESGGCAGEAIANCCIYAGDCDDGNLCTDDFCNGVPENPSGTCSHEDVDCQDPDACTVASCNPADGSCATAARVCNDGLGCTDDACDPVSGCTYPPVDCQATDACHTSSCAEPGMCVDALKECPQDGNLCTVEECQEGECGSVQAVVCDLGEACDPSTGVCTCFTTVDCAGTADIDGCRDQCEAVAGCPTDVCDNFYNPDFAGTVDLCINQGNVEACKAIDAFGRDPAQGCTTVCPL